MAIRYKKQIKKIAKNIVKNTSKVERILGIERQLDGSLIQVQAYCCNYCDYDVWDWYSYCPTCGKKLIWTKEV